MSKNEYDELGRLKKVNKGGAETLPTEYTYNVRSWVKKISSPVFTQELYYNDNFGGRNRPSYNGNISAINCTGTTVQKVRNAADEFTERLCNRLRDVTIENDDALKIIKRYDNEDAFHFVDPLYVNSDCGHYEGMFTDADMLALIGLLSQIKGKFMLTMFPYEAIEAAANENGWIIHRVERTISASKESRRKQEEWIVCNYSKSEASGQIELF